MIRYPALIDGDEGAYGVVFPDIPGVGAMGDTVDEALLNAEDTLRDYAIEAEKDGEALAEPSPFQAIETPKGSQLTSIPLIRTSGKSVRAGLTLDEGVAEFIDTEAHRRGMTRKAYITWMARRIAAMGG
ncbi:MAG: type II toxin-antitoxin system HicB family antitoxin [Chloroflexi bacterium]|nr:type II toxin-antitoxin system HicB family antitoxin [Chloroflexota bacterium]